MTLRLEPQEGTLEGRGLEGRLEVYESSMRGPTGQRLLTVCVNRPGHPPTGLRLTPEQVVELHNYTADWLGLGQ